MARGKYIRTPKIRKKTSESNKIALNKPEAKKRMSESRKGRIISEETKKKISESNKISQNKPEVKSKISEKMKGKNNPMFGKFGREHPMFGKHHSEKAKEKIRKGNMGKKLSEETKKKISDAIKGEKHWNYGKHLSDETKKKIGRAHKGKIISEEQKKKISDALSGEKNHNWNPNREEVYAPYGENFYNQNIKNEKWNLQNGRDMLTGTKLDPDKKPAYHHIDYCKSNDGPNNHCFISKSNHSRITNYQSNLIKSERYKKILQENTLALKNGQIPKNWSPLNKEMFRQEKLKQLDLSYYI